MPVVLNEVKQAEHILEFGEVGNKPTSTLFLLGKYFRKKQGLNREQTFQKLDEFMRNNYKNYNPALWEYTIADIAKKSNRYSLREIDYISITDKEMEKIETLNNLSYMKLLFTMLCYAKLYNKVSESNNGWVNTDIREIYKNARVTIKHKEDKFLYLNDIEQTGLIAFSRKNDNLNLQVTFIDDGGDEVLRIHDFRELGYEYLNYYKIGSFTRCSRCQRLVRKKSNKANSTKYCSKCAAHIKNEQNKMYYKSRQKSS